jgi:heme exporter protein D
MMPELGKYAFAVLASYGVTGLVLAALIGASLWRGARVRDELRRIEAQRDA